MIISIILMLYCALWLFTFIISMKPTDSAFHKGLCLLFAGLSLTMAIINFILKVK